MTWATFGFGFLFGAIFGASVGAFLIAILWAGRDEPKCIGRDEIAQLKR